MKVKVRKKPVRKVELAEQAKSEDIIKIPQELIARFQAMAEKSIRQCRYQNQ